MTEETFKLTQQQVDYADTLRSLLLAALPLAGGALASEGLPPHLANALMIRELLWVAAATAYQIAIEEGRGPNRELWMQRCGEVFDDVAKAVAKREAAKAAEAMTVAERMAAHAVDDMGDGT